MLCLLTSVASQAEPINYFHKAYFGALGGYGSTTWKGLVPSKENQNLAMSMSTPLTAEEGGTTWGAFIGYEFTPFFALEANYVDYPDARIGFDEFSLFAFENPGIYGFRTHTEAFSLMAKIMLVIPNTYFRVYSSAGVANLHRDDFILDDWRLTPTFGVGINYHFSEHFMGEFGGNYTAGFGESQLRPADTYYPFITSATVRLAYFF